MVEQDGQELSRRMLAVALAVKMSTEDTFMRQGAMVDREMVRLAQSGQHPWNTDVPGGQAISPETMSHVSALIGPLYLHGQRAGELEVSQMVESLSRVTAPLIEAPAPAPVAPVVESEQGQPVLPVDRSEPAAAAVQESHVWTAGSPSGLNLEAVRHTAAWTEWLDHSNVDGQAMAVLNSVPSWVWSHGLRRALTLGTEYNAADQILGHFKLKSWTLQRHAQAGLVEPAVASPGVDEEALRWSATPVHAYVHGPQSLRVSHPYVRREEAAAPRNLN